MLRTYTYDCGFSYIPCSFVHIHAYLGYSVGRIWMPHQMWRATSEPGARPSFTPRSQLYLFKDGVLTSRSHEEFIGNWLRLKPCTKTCACVSVGVPSGRGGCLTPGKVFSSGLDLEEHAPTFLAMTSPSPAGDLTRDPARKSFEIARFVSGMQDSLASLDRYNFPSVVLLYLNRAQIAFLELYCCEEKL